MEIFSGVQNARGNVPLEGGATGASVSVMICQFLQAFAFVEWLLAKDATRGSFYHRMVSKHTDLVWRCVELFCHSEGPIRAREVFLGATEQMKLYRIC